MKREMTVSDARKNLETFIKLAKCRARKNPLIVVMLMHEYFRNLYPVDTFIPKRFSGDYLKNVILCLDKCIETLKQTEYIGTYFKQGARRNASFCKNVFDLADTHKVYGKLWEKLSPEYICSESANVLKTMFRRNGFDPEFIRGKKVIDVGCGSGRFSLALAKLGASRVIGVDLGDEGIKIGRNLARSLKLKNVKFMKHTVLNLPFSEGTFDFVFCKGVLHHTGNLKRGLDELYRVLKPEGRAFLYLYADGGIFWYSRKKMREVMKLIPIDYAVKVLDMLGMPSKRYIFIDSWYVPIEEHASAAKLERYLKRQGYDKIERIKKGGTYELESVVFGDYPYARQMWGDGELRYFLYKGLKG